MKYLPNILTIARMGLSVALLASVIYIWDFLPSYVHYSWANLLFCIIFMIAAFTDFFDGYIARNYNYNSSFGEIFDPLADKMLILSALMALLLLDRVSAWAVFLILSREFYVSGLRSIVAKTSANLSANNFGKIKTTFQIASIALLLLGYTFLGNILLWCAVAITLYSGYIYTKDYFRYIG